MNATMEKFGYPATLVREFEHWAVLLRPAQPTLGSLVLAAKSQATRFSELSAPAFAELQQVTLTIEDGLERFTRYSKINYLMLMMVDPHVHFHVIPRYKGERQWSGVTFTDAGWPGVPDLSQAVKLEDGLQTALLREIKSIL